jgi:Recombination endonuclease VII
VTEAEYLAMLEAQGNACAMCKRPFAADERVFADHDHACCPAQVDQMAKTCGKCIRGLLCFRCNTALGYVELYGDLASSYLTHYAASRSA